MTRLTSDDPLINGTFEIYGDVLLCRTAATATGRLMRQRFVMESDYGQAQYTMLGTDQYQANWGSYQFRKGLAGSGAIDQPFIELHFQRRGFTRGVHSALGPRIEMRPGDHNLVFVPSLTGYFEICEDSAGSIFEVHLSVSYFQTLAERHPELLGPFLEKMLRGEPFWLAPRPLRTTPRMEAIIDAVEHREADTAAALLLFESQLLELLSLQLDQMAAGPPPAPARADLDRLHAARDVLLGRMTDPPTLAELARTVGTNEFTLKRGFREVFGTSPYALLLRHKLETARRLLLDTRLTVAEVAYRVGYRHPAHFTNAFRKHYGIRPSDLR